MGDPQGPRATSFSLPPGCRFYPSEEHLLCYYLTNKNKNVANSGNDENTSGYDLIKEMDLFDYDPFELPDFSCFSYGYGGRKRHWYCYTFSVVKKTGGGKRRTTKSGYWRRKGKARDVMDLGGNVLGTKTSFVFYLLNSPKNAVRTDWIVYEYALSDHPKASFVLCRVFLRSCRRNSISENGLSCCGEESVSAMRHVGIQHDGFLIADFIEPKLCDGNPVGWRTRISRQMTNVDDQVIKKPVSSTDFQFPSDFDSTEMVKFTAPANEAMLSGLVVAECSHSILEGDFIELDDLVD